LQGAIYISIASVIAKYFSCTFLLFKNATNLAAGHQACISTPSQISIDIPLQ